MRKCLLGLTGLLVAAGVAVADKPAGGTIDPHVEGREPTPLAREFYQPDPAPSRGSFERQDRPSDEQVRSLVILFRLGR